MATRTVLEGYNGVGGPEWSGNWTEVFLYNRSSYFSHDTLSHPLLLAVNQLFRLSYSEVVPSSLTNGLLRKGTSASVVHVCRSARMTVGAPVRVCQHNSV